MSKKSRLNVEPSLEDLDSWWGKMDVHTKNWIMNISKNTINAGKESNVVQSLDDYVGKRKEFLKELPKTLIDDWGVGRTVMSYVTHTSNVVIYTLTQEWCSDINEPTFDSNRQIYDSKTVALFYAHAGKRKNRPYPVARRSETSDRLHTTCNTNPVLKHLVIEDRKNKNYHDSSCWCNQFLWSLGFPVSEKF